PVSEGRSWYQLERGRVHRVYVGAGSTVTQSGQGTRQGRCLVVYFQNSNENRLAHCNASKQYTAVSTIAVSSTPWPKSATTVGRASVKRISSRQCWNLTRKNPVRDVIAPNIPRRTSQCSPRSTNAAYRSFLVRG